jgi:hypothetical protein
MEEQHKSERESTTGITGQSHGRKGVDKAPEEEQPGDTLQFSQQTQKGKKVDRDPGEEPDEPLEQDLPGSRKEES